MAAEACFRTAGTRLAWVGLLCSVAIPAGAQGPRRIPETQATALDGHKLTLPRDLPAAANVLILGFGRHSQDATTAWEKLVRTQLAKPGSVGFYDMAMLAEVPGFLRPMVLRAVKRKVPDVLKPNFLPLTDGEDAWKKIAGYTANQDDDAYVMLVDKAGSVRWATTAPCTPQAFAELSRRAHALASTG